MEKQEQKQPANGLVVAIIIAVAVMIVVLACVGGYWLSSMWFGFEVLIRGTR